LNVIFEKQKNKFVKYRRYVYEEFRTYTLFSLFMNDNISELSFQRVEKSIDQRARIDANE